MCLSDPVTIFSRRTDRDENFRVNPSSPRAQWINQLSTKIDSQRFNPAMSKSFSYSLA